MRALFVVIASVLCACGSIARPIANAGPAQRTAMAGVALTFDGSASTGTISSYVWDFGDQTDPVTAEMVNHAFASDGAYTVTLTARGPGGASAATVLVTVGAASACSAMPVIVPPDSPMPGTPLLFHSTGSTGCMDAGLKQYAWDFGDDSGIVDGGTEKQTVTHTYAAMGTYDVSLQVVDVNDHVGVTHRSLGVGITSLGTPTVTCASTLNGQTNRPVHLTANGSDPGNMSLTFTWAFSEGGSAMGSNVPRTYVTAGSYTATVVASTPDSRMSAPCTTDVTIIAPPNYTGDWLVSPTGSSFTGACPFPVGFPTAALSIFNTANPDGGGALLVVTPTGGTYSAGYEMSGTEDLQTPGSFVVSRQTPNETECNNSQRTIHTLHLLFSSATLVGGNWTKQYDGCVDPSCLSCDCLAGGPMNGAFTGVKQ